MKAPPRFTLIVLLLSGLGACSDANAAPIDTAENPAPQLADVISVTLSGAAGSYTAAVRVRSPDSGCAAYADWWEVLSTDGTLLYRRILAHSHVDEQPFTRSGGSIAITADTEVIVRAHFSVGGYGGAAMRGSASTDFSKTSLAENFAAAVEDSAPQPDGCAF